MKLKEFNQLSSEERNSVLSNCCVASNWVSAVNDAAPFKDADDLLQKAAGIWYDSCSETDHKEAFAGHPKIGDMDSLNKKFLQTKDWAEGEQAAVAHTSEKTIEALAQLNQEYEAKFGYIFIVSATGKSAEEMLALIQHRLNHDAATELVVAMGEQHKITCIRLVKLIEEVSSTADLSSHVTTHVLDTSTGIPGNGMLIRMKAMKDNDWQTISMGITNADGRIGDLLPPALRLTPGNYLMGFDTEGYYATHDQKGFYPKVDIQFKLSDETHYHIPLLLNPYGFTTYRGS